MIKNIFFDFDGTLVDSKELVLNYVTQHTSLQLPPIEELRKIPSDKITKVLNISHFELFKMIYKVRKEISRNVSKLKIDDQIIDAFYRFKEKGCNLFICTSNSKKNVVAVLKAQKIEPLFTDVVSIFSLFGKAKGVEKVMKKYALKADETIYIGDETRDIEVANKLGIKSCAVTWGYHDKVTLNAYQPDYILDKPEEFCRLLQ